MSAILNAGSPQVMKWSEWLPIGVGILVAYIPTFYRAATGFWQMDEHAHGPIILTVILWMIWTKRAELNVDPMRPVPLTGTLIVVIGLLFYVLGRSQDIVLFEIGALIPILSGVLLAMRGGKVLRAFWFPILFVAFMVPLPGSFTDAVTGTLKQYVSVLAEQILYAADYPIARSGVMLTIGQYQLLVADACSGLNTMFSLAALGTLFMYLTNRGSKLHNLVMLASILPIAFIANVVRVLVLILITYYFGDEAGQGYLHGFSGLVLLMVALTTLLVLDAVLVLIIKPRAT